MGKREWQTDMDFIYWCFFSTTTVDHHYSLSIAVVSFHYRGVINEWYRYQLSTTTHLCCMAWTLLIDGSSCDRNPWPSFLYYSLSPSYRSFIVVWWTNDIDTSCQHNNNLCLLFITASHAVHSSGIIFLWVQPSTNITSFYRSITVCFEQRVITPANNLLCGDLSQPFNCSKRSWDYEQMLSQPAAIDNLFIIALHGVYLFYSGDCSTTSGEWLSNMICLTKHISQYYIIHIPKTTNTMFRC